MAVYVNEGAFICDYYVCCDQKCEFVYTAAGSQPVKGFTLSKKFLQEQIFPKYKEQAAEIKSQSILRYKTNVRKRVLKHREDHLKDANKKSSYKHIQVTENVTSHVS